VIFLKYEVQCAPAAPELDDKYMNVMYLPMDMA